MPERRSCLATPLGFEPAVIMYDVKGGPPELVLPPDPSEADIERFIDDVLERFGSTAPAPARR